MLKLKYLFNNVDLAEMIIENWVYDRESLDLFKNFRISSNAVYPFQSSGEAQFLRFAPKTEKNRENSLAELDFISYLQSKQYGVLETVLSKSGKELVEMQTPWGEYAASVFRRVEGVKIDATDVSDQVIFSYGKALGKLHHLSSEYHPGNAKHWTYKDVLQWIENILVDFPDEKLALLETKLLQDYFDSIPKKKNNFGLIHFDFEYDNVFYDEVSGSFNIIDFDDAMYHWYVMDIEKTLDSLRDCIPPEKYEQKKQCFLEGYRTEFEISEEMKVIIPACRRFADLYAYVRLVRAAVEKWENEPQWLSGLREHLSAAIKNKSDCFGKKL